MAISIGTQTNIDKSNLAAYPNGQILDNTGPGTGTPIICVTASDIWMFFDKLMRQAQLPFNATFDNETNGYQFVQACVALASKSDFILALTTVTDILQIQTNLDILQLNEKLICQAAADWTTEVQIKGTTATLLDVTITRQYKAGDYLILIRTAGGVQLISLATADNFEVLADELGYLKAASDGDEDTGTAVDVATTPASNLYIFTKRVTDPTAADPFLATDSTPGLMSAADKTALDGFSSPIKNVGTFSGVNPGSGTIGAFAPRTGNVVTAQITSKETGSPGSTTYLVTLANAMDGTNYFVRTSILSAGTMDLDNDTACPVFSPQSATTFLWSVQATVASSKSLTIIIEAVNL